MDAPVCYAVVCAVYGGVGRRVVEGRMVEGMSGVYIKGIQKPSQCDECKICNWIPIGEYDLMLKCPLLERKVGFDERREDCPLIPVSDHGRLIDEDVIEAEMQELWLENEISNSDWIGFREVLSRISTIIPADKEGEAWPRS